MGSILVAAAQSMMQQIKLPPEWEKWGAICETLPNLP